METANNLFNAHPNESEATYNTRNENAGTFFLCECNTEGILITRFEGDPLIYLAMFTYGSYTEKPSLWKRFKFAWWHLRTGKYYTDQIVLTKEAADKIANELTK